MTDISIGTVLDTLSAIVDCVVVTDPEVMAGYATDWTGRWTGQPSAVVRPRTVDAASEVLAVCERTRTAVVPQGGNTGLVGGTIAPAGSVIVSTELLTHVGEVDERGRVTVGAGVTLGALESLAESEGRTTGLTLASGASATVGGAVATNAGGARVLRYGTARDRIAGLRAVTATGAVIDRRQQLDKDNTGFDLPNMLVGSEGTLALITDVTWKLVPRDSERAVVVFAFATAGDAVSRLRDLRALPGLRALDWATGVDVQRVADHIGVTAPLPTDGFWVFAEMGSSSASAYGMSGSFHDRIETALSSIVGSAIAEDRLAVATTAKDARRLWSFREQMTETINAEGVPVKLDVAVPLPEFQSFLEVIPRIVASTAPGTRTALFGHLAEGNFHINLLPSTSGQRIDDHEAELLEHSILTAVVAARGTVSAEHGIGRAKAEWLSVQRGSAQTDIMAAIKRAWDPSSCLNPGVLFS